MRVATSRRGDTWEALAHRATGDTEDAAQIAHINGFDFPSDVSRSGDLGMSVATLTEYLDDLGLGAEDVRVWIEGLPASAESASRLLDELAR